MNITRNNIDSLNAVLDVEITKEDYQDRVEKLLANYRKNANIPGFRKGEVPMSLIRKQYGKGVMLEEVNKLLQENLNKYLQEEKLDILGNPLPKADESMDWDADTLRFQFELGLTPEVSANLENLKGITKYKVTADEKMLDEQVMRIRKQYGKLISKNEFEAGADVTGTFRNQEMGIENRTTFSPEIFAGKDAQKAFEGKKPGDVVTLNTKGLFDDDHKLMDYLKVGHDDVHGLDTQVEFTIEEINASEPAELNQELFDKLFGPGNVSSEQELRDRIREDAEKQFASQADQKFLNDVTEALIETTKFDLPAAFLKKWIRTAGENPLNEEEAEDEYNKSEKGLRYQLIEARVMRDHEVKVNFEDLKAYTSAMIRKQMAQFGQMDPSQEDVDGIVARVMSNQDEVRRLTEQVVSEKMLNLFKEKVSATEKTVSYEQFVKEMYGE